ncbi:DUF992 domain-containing protein [Bradyrhizobium sp. SYSU BS000235]|uniref:DUF992 domain-containing protein n=1 Tax=Bradyrhizobium sp. SYSU BS000235 TaxID=3411332 RepID=UPI003C71836F
MSKTWLTAVACFFVIASALPASAQGTRSTRVGGLTCESGPSVGLVVGSRQNLRCVFRSVATGRRYTYRGTVTRVGLDLGVTAGGRLFWAVFAPSRVTHRSLRGTYVGASADASLGLGLGANVLIGGSNRTISLQPLSVEGQVGINVALGVTRLVLR